MPILKGENGKEYDLGALNDFLEKSKVLQPRCFGAYDKDDLVCQEYCARSKKGDEDMKAYEVRVKMNEEFADLPCFIYPWGVFCENIRNKLEEKKEEIQRELEELDEKRVRRDNYWLLAGARPGLPRLPVGKIREVEILRDFTHEAGLNLEIKGADGSNFSWANHHPEVMARLWRGKESDPSLAFVKSVMPELPQRHWDYPIEVRSQQEDGNGNLILTAVVSPARHGEIDYHKAEGKELTILVISGSAKTTMTADDKGLIFHDRRYE